MADGVTSESGRGFGLPNRTLLIAALLLGSGASALAYQMVWLRMLRQIFGVSTEATGAVLAIFMGGLGFGSLFWAGRAERSRHPFRLYAKLELFVAASAALSPLLVHGVREVYLALGGAEALGGLWGTTLRLSLSALVLGPGVFAMGGTLPAVARTVSEKNDEGRGAMAFIYGANAIGGVVGTLVGNFVLFEWVGVRMTLFAAVGLNVLVAAAAWRVSMGRETAVPADAAEPESGESVTAVRPGSPLLIAAFASGFVFLLGELVWSRMAAPILSGSTYTFGVILVVALTGVGVGGLAYSWAGNRFGRRIARPSVLALTFALESLLLLLPFAAGDELASIAHGLRSRAGGDFAAMAEGWLIVASLLCLPAALVAGFQFPLLVALAGRGREGVAQQVGWLYAANTAGSITGSLLGGFLLLPLLGALDAWRLAGLILVVLAVPTAFAALGRAAVARERGAPMVALVLAAFAVVAAIAEGPTAVWRHAGIGAGRASIGQGEWETFRRQKAWEVPIEREGRESALGFGTAHGLSLISGGKSDGNAVGDAITTVSLGVVGALLHPDPKTAYVVGLGAGQSAGFLAEVPSIEHVDVVELEPRVHEFAEMVGVAAANVTTHPKVSIHFADGREHLATRKGRYDIIVSEPSNPYRAGVSAFFTQDFFESALSKLADDGVFVQWIQGYEITPDGISMALSTLRSVFGSVVVLVGKPTDYLIVASREPIVFDMDLLRSRLSQPPFTDTYRRLSSNVEPEGVLSRVMATPAVGDHLAQGVGHVVNTDDHPRLEFLFARMVGSHTGAPSLRMLHKGRELGEARPSTRGDVDWDKVERLRARLWYAPDRPAPPLVADHPEARLLNALVRGDLTKANEHLKEVTPDLIDTPLRLAIAEVRSRTERSVEQSAALASELAALAPHHPAEVAWLRVFAAMIDRDEAAVARAATAAFALARADPWSGMRRTGLALKELGQFPFAPPVARQLALELDRGPFAGYLAETDRWDLTLALATAGEDLSLCTDLFARHEPRVRATSAALSVRARCYEATGHPLAAQALADARAVGQP